LERELVKQQQQNLLLQTQKEIERLEAQVDRNLFSQAQVSSGKQAIRGKLAQVPEEVETSSPETAILELGDSDSPPPPTQNRPMPVKRTPAVVSVGVQVYPAPVSEPVVPKVAVSVVSPSLGVATGVPLPSSEGPLIIPRGPEVVATPLPVASPVAPPLYTGVMATCSLPMPPSGIMSAPPSSVAASVPVVALGTDTRPTFVSLGAPLSSAPPIVDTKAVPVASVVTSAGAPYTSQEPVGAGRYLR